MEDKKWKKRFKIMKANIMDMAQEKKDAPHIEFIHATSEMALDIIMMSNATPEEADKILKFVEKLQKDREKNEKH